MARIEEMISRFNDTSLLGVNREIVKDTFSDVTAHLKTVLKDLSQERVNILSPGLEQELDGTDAATNQAEKQPQRARVSTFDVIPFE